MIVGNDVITVEISKKRNMEVLGHNLSIRLKNKIDTRMEKVGVLVLILN